MTPTTVLALAARLMDGIDGRIGVKVDLYGTAPVITVFAVEGAEQHEAVLARCTDRTPGETSLVDDDLMQLEATGSYDGIRVCVWMSVPVRMATVTS